ncbi:hypothetical protein ACP70R_000480 [Stipagrostis hirtigluma subsp. patula]
MVDSGFLEFKLDYAQTKDLAVGDLVLSEVIAAAGHQWRIICYPRGHNKDDNGEHLSIYHEILSKPKQAVKAIFVAFAMLAPLWYTKRCTLVYRRSGDAFGWHRFMRRSSLDTLPQAMATDSGWVTIMCGVIVLLGDHLAVPPSDVGAHLGHLLDCADGSDVAFVVDGETFPAHRAVLASRSPVFKAQLLGSMADATIPSIKLHDVASATFKVMLRFMYTDALPGDDELGDSPAEVFHSLLAVADRYALDRLKLVCASKIWEGVTVDTVASILACAETYNCPELKKKCIAFLADDKNFRDAVLTDGFVQLVQKHPSIIADLKKGGR